MEGRGHDQICGTIQVFAKRDVEEPQKSSVSQTSLCPGGD